MNFGALFRKAFTFLLPIIREEVRKEIQKRTDEPPPVRPIRSTIKRPPAA